MTQYLLRRFAGALAVLLALSAIVYVLFYLLPSNPAELICGRRCDATQVAQTAKAYGLSDPVYTQYWHFLEGLVVGRDYDTGPSVIHCAAPCLGYSFVNSEPVTTLLGQTIPVSLSLTLGAAVLWTVLGVTAGVVSALRRDTVVDRLMTVLVLVGFATPVFLVALGLLLLFCVWLRWLPFPSYVGISQDPAQWAKNFILPWLALALTQASTYARLTRTGLVEAMNEDHIRTARAYGLTERRIIARHALRAALTPLVTVLAIDVGVVLASATLTESVFGLPGLGKLLVGSVNDVDLPVVSALTLVAGFAVVVANTIADLLYAAIDPRVAVA
jgi:peptide/nickel transport system permease protein